jgi:hypothetical protein
MGNPTPIRGSLYDVRVIMVIMRVLVQELICQVVTGWISVLEYLFVRSIWVQVATSYHSRH